MVFLLDHSTISQVDSMENITIILTDDHPAFRMGVSSCLSKHPDFEIVSECSNGKEAVAAVVSDQPNVLLLDMAMPLMDGVAVARALKENNATTLVLPLSGYSDPDFVFGVLEAGARGYLMKDEPISAIPDAIRRIVAGGISISSRVSMELVSRQHQVLRNEHAEDLNYNLLLDLKITPRLLRVLQLASEGMTNKEIAKREFRSEHTIRNQVETLKGLIGVKWRPALVAWAWKQGIVNLDEAEFEARYAVRRR